MTAQQSTLIPVAIKDLVGFEGYRLDTNGVFWSSLSGEWKPLKVASARNGYRFLTLRQGGRDVQVWVHTMVLTAFVGPRPDGYEACHGNGIRSDNRLQNLRWDTRANNNRDKALHGKLKGELNPASKLDDASILDIRRRHAAGETTVAIAERFGIARDYVLPIVRGIAWSHVPGLIRPDRVGPPRGESHRCAKLTSDKVIEIRRRHADGQSVYSLAKMYGIRKSTMRAAIMGVTWKDVVTPAEDVR